MKLTLWQRLNAALVGVGLLLMAGFLLELWAKGKNWEAVTRREQLGGTRDRINMDMMRMSDAMRGRLLEPSNELEKRRGEAAESDLKLCFERLQRIAGDRPELMGAVKKVRDVVRDKVEPFEGRVM